jgi:UDP-N-acetylmuramate: L-alanyl-gamma-D-glutamyl-meso-diaminopimelate ligase
MPFISGLGKGGRIHFTGICGTAMASVAGELHALGYTVTGSDSHAYPPMSTFLENIGIKVIEGFDAGNLDPAPDLTVIGNAVSRGNPEVEEALEKGLPFTSLAELIGSVFLPGKAPVVVTGTHGKTTTTALITWIMRESGLDPSWLIGGVPLGLGAGFKVGKGAPFVLEGDEYDTAFFDKRSKFLHYRPRVLILNNLEYDHADIYPDMERLRETFRHLLRIVPRGGLIIANADEPEVMALLSSPACPVVTYTMKGAKADYAGTASPGKLRVAGPEGFEAEISHEMVGSHQGWNILAGVIACRRFGLDAGAIASGIKSFPGVKRRAEKRGVEGGVTVFDDFAHHPTAIRTTLSGFRELYPGRRIFALLEPRSNTMRRAVFQEALETSFADADFVAIREVPNPEKVPGGKVLDVRELAGTISGSGVPAEVFPDAGAIIDRVLREAGEGDVVVVLSNGGFEDIHERLLSALREKR